MIQVFRLPDTTPLVCESVGNALLTVDCTRTYVRWMAVVKQQTGGIFTVLPLTPRPYSCRK